jgi:hypothetical protein
MTGEPAPAPPPVRRKVLSKLDGPVPGYVTIAVEVAMDPGSSVPLHTHPGIETTYVLEGGITSTIGDTPPRPVHPGEVFQAPPGIPHNVVNGDKPSRAAVIYVVEKDKPLQTNL